MKFLVLLVLLFGACTAGKTVSKTSGLKNTHLPFLVDSNSSVVKSHPEYPLIASPHNSAWEVGIWLALIIFVICISPALSRLACKHWFPFVCWCRKCLTKKKSQCKLGQFFKIQGVFWIRLMLDSYTASRRCTWLRYKGATLYMAISHVLKLSVSKRAVGLPWQLKHLSPLTS